MQLTGRHPRMQADVLQSSARTIIVGDHLKHKCTTAHIPHHTHVVKHSPHTLPHMQIGPQQVCRHNNTELLHVAGSSSTPTALCASDTAEPQPTCAQCLLPASQPFVSKAPQNPHQAAASQVDTREPQSACAQGLLLEQVCVAADVCISLGTL